jgi:hypothetical protein
MAHGSGPGLLIGASPPEYSRRRCSAKPNLRIWSAKPSVDARAGRYLQLSLDCTTFHREACKLDRWILIVILPVIDLLIGACMRAVLICASCLLLAGCTSEEWKLRDALRADIAANPQTAAIVIALLIVFIVVLLWVLAGSKNRAASPVERQPFPDWLAGASWGTPDVLELRTYSKDMHWTTNDINTLRQTIQNDSVISPADKARRTSTLEALHRRWQGEFSSSQGFLIQLMPYVFANGIGIFLSFFGVAVFLVLAIGMSNSSFFSSLAQVDQARGLITFLVAICAVAVILLTAINIFWGNNAGFDERFKAAKDLVTLVVGVLGTILGFYFGSVSSDHLLQLSFDKPASYSSVIASSKIPVAATAKNGVAPFSFDLLVLDEKGDLVSKDAENKQSDKAFVTQEIKAPEKPGKYSIVLLVRDTKGQQTKSTVDIVVTAAAAAPPTVPAEGTPTPSGAK